MIVEIMIALVVTIANTSDDTDALQREGQEEFLVF